MLYNNYCENSHRIYKNLKVQEILESILGRICIIQGHHYLMYTPINPLCRKQAGNLKKNKNHKKPEGGTSEKLETFENVTAPKITLKFYLNPNKEVKQI